MYVILLSCVALILQFLPPVALINIPLSREVGKEVLFMINVSTSIGVVRWGIRDGNTFYLKPVLMSATNHGVNNHYNNGSRYAGRVSFVGDLSKGQAWFKITNLNINDTNMYMAQVLTQEASGYKYEITQLNVRMPLPTTRPLQNSITASTSISVVSSNITSSAPRNTTSTTSSQKSARKRNLSSIKGEDIGAYENANQMDDASTVQETSKPKLVEKELYETICENRDEGSNTDPGVGNLGAKKVTTRDPSVSGQDPVPSLPQHYQELTNIPEGQQIPLYEPLNKRNTNHSTNTADNPRTYEQLQQNVTGREYQSLKIIPNKEESKV